MINQKDELDIREGDIVQSKIKCVVSAKGQCVLREREREKEDSYKNHKKRGYHRK